MLDTPHMILIPSAPYCEQNAIQLVVCTFCLTGLYILLIHGKSPLYS